MEYTLSSSPLIYLHSINLKEDMIIAVLILQFKKMQITLKKNWGEFNGMQNHGLCIRATVLYQLSYELQ